MEYCIDNNFMKKTLISSLILSSIFVFTFSVAEAKAKPKASYKSPTALCKDGTYSYSVNHRGTCSGHKGVRIWYK